nr:uncharacterized protein LOC117364739 isoform X2 [Geotrypetes seraphini]
MASGRITREKFDAMVQEKVEMYGMSVDEAIKRTIQQCRFQGPPSRPSMRNEGDGRFSFDKPYWKDEFNPEPFPNMEFDSAYRRFQAGPQYGPSSLSPGEMGGHHMEHPRPSRPKFLCPEDRGKFYKSLNRVKREKPQVPAGDGQEGLSKTKKGHKKIKRTEPTEETDIMSKFGSQIIKWAGFNSIQNDSIFKEQHETLFKVDTESCAKTLAAYKCSIKEAQQDFCYFSFNNAKNAALRTPSIDNDLLSMLKDKNIIQSRNGFIELLNPIDKELMTVQARLLKAGIPLLMACNAFEIDQKTEGLKSTAQFSNALEKSISLCRKSLVLVGQTFAFVTSCRQEKILDLLGLSEKAPKPSGFPNLDDSALFGKEYLTYLKIWMESTGCNFKLKKEEQAIEGNSKTSIKQEMVESKECSVEEESTDLSESLLAEGKEVPVMKTSEDDKDNPILTAIKELNTLQPGEESQEMTILQAFKESLLKKEAGSAADTNGKEGTEIPFLEADAQGMGIPVLHTCTTGGMEIPVLQTREERIKHISPKPHYLRPSQVPQKPGSEQGQIQQLTSVRRGSTYKFAQTGANLRNLLTFPESQPKPSVCKANEDLQHLQTENLKAMETIDLLMNNAISTTMRGRYNDQDKPPFWFLFDESSMEYKYYRLKLAQFQRLRQVTVEIGIQTKLLKTERFGGGASKHKKVKRTSRTTQTVLSAAVMLQARRAQVSTKLKCSQSEQVKSKQKLSTTEGHLSKRCRPEKRSRSDSSRSSVALAKRQRSIKPKLIPTSGSSLPTTHKENYSSSSRASRERDSRSERRSLSGSSGSSRERSSTSKCHQSEKHTGAAPHKKDPSSKLSHVKSHNRSEEPSVAELTASSQKKSELAKSSEYLKTGIHPEQPSGTVKSSKGISTDSHASEPAVKSETLMATQLLGVDLKTMDTADKLAQFVAQVGPEIEKFSRENIANNPEFWFLNSRKSAAYRYYRMKVIEVCRAMGKSSYLEALKAQEDEVDRSDSESATEEPMILKQQQQEKSGPGLEESKIPETQEAPTKVQAPQLAVKTLQAPSPAQQAVLARQAQEASAPASPEAEEAPMSTSPEAEEATMPVSPEAENSSPLVISEAEQVPMETQGTPTPAPTETEGEQRKEIVMEERELETYTDEPELGLKELKPEETDLIKSEVEFEESSSQPSEDTEMKVESGDEAAVAPDDDSPPLSQDATANTFGPVTRKRGSRPLQQPAGSPKPIEEAQVEDPARTSSEKPRGRPGRPRRTKLDALESDSKPESSPGMALRKKGAKESPTSASAVKLGSASSGEGLGVAGSESMDDTL